MSDEPDERRHSRPLQFGLGSLFFCCASVALVLALLRLRQGHVSPWLLGVCLMLWLAWFCGREP